MGILFSLKWKHWIKREPKIHIVFFLNVNSVLIWAMWACIQIESKKK